MRDRAAHAQPTTLADTLAERGYVACRCGAAQKRAKHPWVCGRRGCSSTSAGRPNAAGHPLSSGDVGSTPTRQSTSKPRAGKAAEDALAALLAGAGYEVIDFRTWLWRALDGTRFTGFVREFVVGSLLAEPRRFRADLFHPATRTCVEIEGGAHGVQRQRRGDILRAQLIEAAGLRILRVLPEQVTNGDALALVRGAVTKE